MMVAVIQNNPIFGEKEKNMKNIFSLMSQKKAELYILPELAYTGYQFISEDEVRELSDEPDSPYIAMMEQKSKDLNAGIIFGFAEKNKNGNVYNSAMFVTPSGEKHIYRKIHLFYKEKTLFSPGQESFKVVPFKGVMIGIAICFDWIFPESFRTLALKGAQLIAHCSNLVMPYCQNSNYARAIENQVFIFTANRIGREKRLEEELIFTGESVCVSPKGEYLFKGTKKHEQILTSSIDPLFAKNKQLNKYNNLFQDRRPEFYQM